MDTMSQMSVQPLSLRFVKQVVELRQYLSPFVPTEEQYTELWSKYELAENVFAVVAVLNDRVIGYGALVVEQKIRGGLAGHIEDIVTHPDFRALGVGRNIIQRLTKKARDNGCYKLALQCEDKNVEFYEKCGFDVSGKGMQRFLTDNS